MIGLFRQKFGLFAHSGTFFFVLRADVHVGSVSEDHRQDFAIGIE